MARRLLDDVRLVLAIDQKQMLQSLERVTKSTEALEERQARISKTVALIDGIQAKWPTSVPISPKPIGKSPRPENESDGNKG